MENNIPSYLLRMANVRHEHANVKRANLSFLDKTILSSARAIQSVYLQAENASKNNFVRKLNPYVKLFSLIYIVIVISVVSNLPAQMIMTAFIFLLFMIARLNVIQVYGKILFLAFIFGFLIMLPASLNVITDGEIIFNLITLDKPLHFWIYTIPQNIGFTANGFQVVWLIFLRVLNSVSIALLIVFTTPFSSFIKSFKIIGVPDTFMMIISLAYKYIFILSRTVEETYFALKSRLIDNIKKKSIRNIVGGRIFFIFRKSRMIYENTYFAMVSRGYSGKIKLNSKYHFAVADWLALIVIVASGIVVILL